MENKKVLKNMIIFISYFLYLNLQTLPFIILKIDYNSLNLNFKIVYLLLYEFIYICMLFFIYRKSIKDAFKDYINNFKSYIKKYMEYWSLAFGLMIISNVVITFILPNSIANNQEAINSIFKIAPIYIIISSVLFAPIVEEFIFRFSLRNIFKSDKVFIIISGFVFGALHVVSAFQSWADLAYIITYAIPGFVFAKALVDSKNIFVPISLHMFHNGFMMLLQIILTCLI